MRVLGLSSDDRWVHILSDKTGNCYRVLLHPIHTKIIEMVKSLSVVLAYLFFLSSAYYLTFYGRLNIDIFQYLTAEDMIKGVLYPLKHSIYFLIFILLVLLATLLPGFNTREHSTWASQMYKKFKIASGINISLIVSLILALVSYYYLQTGNPEKIVVLERTVISIAVCIAMTAVMLYWSVNYKYLNRNKSSQTSESLDNVDKGAEVKTDIKQTTKKEEESGILSLVDYLIIGTAFYLLVSALGFGMLNSKKLQDFIEYDYVIGKEVKLDSLGLNQSEAIYLGAVGNKYLFSDRMSLGTHYIVIDKEKLPVLSIYHCSDLPQGEEMTEFNNTIFLLTSVISGIMLATALALRLFRRSRPVVVTKKTLNSNSSEDLP